MEKMKCNLQKDKKVGEGILCVWKWAIVIMYTILMVTLIYRAVSLAGTWRYPAYSFPTVLYAIGVFGLFPIGVILFLFYKKKGLGIVVTKIVLQVFMIFYLCFMAIYVMLGASALSMSSTTDLKNYAVFDDGVKVHMDGIGLNILPEVIPQEAEQVSYSYRVAAVIDTELVIKASWQYTDQQAYERAKQLLSEREIMDTYEEDGFIKNRFYIDKKENPKNQAIFGCDDTNMQVMYEVKGVW